MAQSCRSRMTCVLPTSPATSAHSAQSRVCLSTTDILAGSVSSVGAILGTVGCLVAPLASTQEMPGAPHAQCDNQKGLQTLPNVPRGQNHSSLLCTSFQPLIPLRTTHLAVVDLANATRLRSGRDVLFPLIPPAAPSPETPILPSHQTMSAWPIKVPGVMKHSHSLNAY